MPTSRPAEPRAAADKNAPILITMGEPGGVGPELAVRAFQALKGKTGSHPLKLVGDPDVFRACGAVDERALIATRPVNNPRKAGFADPANALSVTEAIETAVDLARDGAAAAIVTAPIHKAAMRAGGFSFPGHTEFLAHLTGAERAVMMLAGPDLRVVPLTIHEPLAKVPSLVSEIAIVETGEIILAALKRDFGIAHPRLAVAGLNPHAGEVGRDRPRGDRYHRARPSKPCAARARRCWARSPPTRCSMPKRARNTMRLCACITIRR